MHEARPMGMLPDVMDVDTVVVGAGLAGLSAAHALQTGGQTVTVLEADSEVGGRTRTRELGAGILTEFGGEWVGPRHQHIQRLVAELGLRQRPAHQLGGPTRWRGGQRDTVRRLPALPVSEEVSLLRAFWRLGRLATTVDPVRPWLSPDAAALDSRAFAEWLRDNGVRDDGFQYLATVVGALMSADIEYVSLLHVLWWFARGGGVLRILHTTFARTIVEGSQSIATRLAARLGDRVVLDAAVRRITDTGSVEAETAHGTTVRARRAVVTTPVGALRHLDFDPPLPAALASLDQLQGHPGTKVTALLPHEHRMRHRAAIGGNTVTVAWRAGRRITGYAALGHTEAPDDTLISELAALFRHTSDDLQHAAVYRWNAHDYIPACDIGFAPGQLLRHGPQLTRAHGNVHFAGAERSSWPNNMEGAVESGVNAARTILSG